MPGRVVVPRGGQWGEQVAELLLAVGLEPLVIPLIRTELVDGDEVRRAVAGAQEGRFDWVVLTSAAAVAVLPESVDANLAAVGPATAAAARDAGHRVDHVPADHSASGLLAACRLSGSVLLLRSDLAHPRLAEGLRAAGVTVTDVVAYRTEAAAVPADAAATLAAADAVLVTSGSVARSLARFELGEQAAIVCLGPGTADEARAAGLQVATVARERTAEALVAAAHDVVTALDRRARPHQNSSEEES